MFETWMISNQAGLGQLDGARKKVARANCPPGYRLQRDPSAPSGFLCLPRKSKPEDEQEKPTEVPVKPPVVTTPVTGGPTPIDPGGVMPEEETGGGIMDFISSIPSTYLWIGGAVILFFMMKKR